MRRTDEQFKAEVLRRSEAYRAKRKNRRKHLLTAALCVCLCAGLFLLPQLAMGARSTGSTANMAAPEAMQFYSGTGDCAADAAIETYAPAESASEQMTADSTAKKARVSIGTDGCVYIVLSDEDTAVILECLDGEWTEDLTDCISDYSFMIDGAEMRYSYDCGTFTDVSAKKTLTVTEEQREKINAILDAHRQ